MNMNPEQSREVFEGMMRAGQSFVQNFFQHFSPAAGSAAPTGLPLENMPHLSAPEMEKLQALQREHLARHAALWSALAQSKPGQVTEPLVAEAAKDRRFSGNAWAQSPYYDYLRQAYVLNAQFMNTLVDTLPISDKATKNRLQFATRQYVDALSPANFAATNPEFVQRALDTKGESITSGLMNMIADMEKGRISMTDESAFELGANIATSQGSVVYQNEVMQLIQYAPLTEQVSETPLLIVPPCINKFYILDLQPENSLVRYAVEQGFTVFLVSWCNPQAAQAQLGWDDYVGDGILQALEVVRDISKVAKPNALGFCIGGTLLACALAVARARGEDPVASVTFLTTLLDFAETGDLACFVDEAAVVAKEAMFAKGGLMSGRDLSNVFSTLRPNDLIWNYVVDNYLKGNKPAAFDLLFWNSDGTNLPGPFAAWYLRNTYLENNLRIPGQVDVLGQPLDLGRVDCPAYFFAAKEDHIVPWRTSYLGRRLLNGESRFVLGASGHIAGVVNPASKNKRSFWLSEAPQQAAAQTSQEWLDGAVEHKGSWWTDWSNWLRQRSGGQIAARSRLGNRQYRQQEAAPGSYVKVRI